MILEGFGVRLLRLQHKDIELVRRHRNSDSIRQFMEFREEITPEMQEKWFRSVDTIYNNYFLVEFKGKSIGLIYGAEIDWEKKETGNGGIFIWEPEFLSTPVPLAASLLLTDISFLLGLEKTYIKVLRDNLNAVAFNRNLGYQLVPGQEDAVNQRYVLTKENYQHKAERFRAPFIKLYGDAHKAFFPDPASEVSQNLFRIYETLPEENKRKLVFSR